MAGWAYTLKDMPEDLRKAAKIRAVQEGITLRELIIKAIRIYVEQAQKEHGRE